MKVKVAKNKVAPPFKTAEFDIVYGEGYSRLGSIIDMGVEFEIIRKAGAYLYYNEEKLGQGKDNAKKFLIEHPDKTDEIEAKILASIKKNLVSSDQPIEVEDEQEFMDEE